MERIEREASKDTREKGERKPEIEKPARLSGSVSARAMRPHLVVRVSGSGVDGEHPAVRPAGMARVRRVKGSGGLARVRRVSNLFRLASGRIAENIANPEFTP